MHHADHEGADVSGVTDLFTRDLWEGVGSDLRGEGLRWWIANREHLTGLTVAEMRDIANGLKAGNTVAAQQAIVQRMSVAEWKAYTQGTLDQLRGIAAQRVAVLRALQDIGRRAAKIIGLAILGALGI